MPSRQINEFLQKGNRKKIELVARPDFRPSLVKIKLFCSDNMTIPKASEGSKGSSRLPWTTELTFEVDLSKLPVAAAAAAAEGNFCC